MKATPFLFSRGICRGKGDIIGFIPKFYGCRVSLVELWYGDILLSSTDRYNNGRPLEFFGKGITVPLPVSDAYNEYTVVIYHESGKPAVDALHGSLADVIPLEYYPIERKERGIGYYTWLYVLRNQRFSHVGLWLYRGFETEEERDGWRPWERT